MSCIFCGNIGCWNWSWRWTHAATVPGNLLESFATKSCFQVMNSSADCRRFHCAHAGGGSRHRGPGSSGGGSAGGAGGGFEPGPICALRAQPRAERRLPRAAVSPRAHEATACPPHRKTRRGKERVSRDLRANVPNPSLDM